MILSKGEELLTSIICTQVGLKYIRTLVVRGVIIITFQDRALVRIKIYIIQASNYVCNRPITKYNYTILIIFYICATSTYTTILIYIHAIIHTKYIIC